MKNIKTDFSNKFCNIFFRYMANTNTNDYYNDSIKIAGRKESWIFGHREVTKIVFGPIHSREEVARLMFKRQRAMACNRGVRTLEKRENSRRLFKRRRCEASSRKVQVRSDPDREERDAEYQVSEQFF